jgi:hypothetical protein
VTLERYSASGQVSGSRHLICHTVLIFFLLTSSNSITEVFALLHPPVGILAPLILFDARPLKKGRKCLRSNRWTVRDFVTSYGPALSILVSFPTICVNEIYITCSRCCIRVAQWTAVVVSSFPSSSQCPPS